MTSVLLLPLIVGAIVTLWQLRASLAREGEQRYELCAADMRQAGADWGEGNLVHMDELLKRHRPGNVTDDEWRGFEWFALWKLLHVEDRSISEPVRFAGLCLTPDWKTILIAREDTIEMWETATGQFAGVFAKVEKGVSKLSLSRGEKKVVAYGGLSPTRVWDLVSKRLLAKIPFSKSSLDQRELVERHIALSPDGKRLAVGYNTAITPKTANNRLNGMTYDAAGNPTNGPITGTRTNVVENRMLVPLTQAGGILWRRKTAGGAGREARLRLPL